MRRFSITLACAALLVGSCASDDVGPRQGIGALTGAVGGAFLGEKVGKGRGRVLATAAGAIAGAAVGSDVGRSLDRANAAHAAHASGAPTAHSQQTPVPGFAAPRASGLRYRASTGQDRKPAAGATVRDAQDCRALDEGGLRPSYACRNSLGQWFILQ